MRKSVLLYGSDCAGRLARLLRPILPIGEPQNVGQLASKVADQDDALMETISSEYGSVKSFLENCPHGISNEFEVTKVGAGQRPVFQVSRNAVLGLPAKFLSLSVAEDFVRGHLGVSTINLMTDFRSDLVINSVGSVETEHFVKARRVPPTTGPYAVDQDQFASFIPQDYDRCRLARFVTCDSHTPADSTLARAVQTVSTFSPYHIAITFPQSFAVKTPTDAQPAIKYMLGESGRQQMEPLPRNGVMYDAMTLQELELLMSEKIVRSGFQGVKERKRRIRALLRKKYPAGNPLLDEDVAALFIYDSMEGPLTGDELKTNILPDFGRFMCPVSLKFLKKFPHLFSIEERSTTNWVVTKVLVGMEHGNDTTILSKRDTVLAVASALDSSTPLSLSIALSRCPTSVSRSVKHHFKSVAQMAALHPKLFVESGAGEQPQFTIDSLSLASV